MKLDERYLVLLAEECSEVIKAVTKILRFGQNDAHPETGVTNLDELIQEIGDTMAIVKKSGFSINPLDSRLDVAIHKKLKRLEKYGPDVVPLSFLREAA